PAHSNTNCPQKLAIVVANYRTGGPRIQPNVGSTNGAIGHLGQPFVDTTRVKRVVALRKAPAPLAFPEELQAHRTVLLGRVGETNWELIGYGGGAAAAVEGTAGEKEMEEGEGGDAEEEEEEGNDEDHDDGLEEQR
ncbi:hypothetical protein U1Q18_027876, partial [Sarracenia purpurea var. burkii]